MVARIKGARPARLLLVLLGVAVLAVIGGRPAFAIGSCSPGVKCPKANDDSYTATIGSVLNVPAPGLLGNDQGDSGTAVDVNDSDTNSWLSADVAVHSDGSFTYTPNETGNDTFNYYIQDSAGHWDLGTATVTVLAVVRDDVYATTSGRPLVVKAPGPLANDLGYDIDSLDADLSSANGGDVTMNNDGSFVYTPPAGFSGIDSFTYTVNDSNDDNSYTATVNIGVSKPAPRGTKVAAPNSTVPAGGASGAGASAGGGGSGGGASGAGASAGGGGSNTPGKSGRGSGVAPQGSASTTTVAGRRASNPAGGGSGSGTSGDSRNAAGPAHASSSGGSAAGPIAIAAILAALVATIAAGFVWYRRRHRPVPSQEVPS